MLKIQIKIGLKMKITPEINNDFQGGTDYG